MNTSYVNGGIKDEEIRRTEATAAVQGSSIGNMFSEYIAFYKQKYPESAKAVKKKPRKTDNDSKKNRQKFPLLSVSSPLNNMQPDLVSIKKYKSEIAEEFAVNELKDLKHAFIASTKVVERLSKTESKVESRQKFLLPGRSAFYHDMPQKSNFGVKRKEIAEDMAIDKKKAFKSVNKTVPYSQATLTLMRKSLYSISQDLGSISKRNADFSEMRAVYAQKGVENGIKSAANAKAVAKMWRKLAIDDETNLQNFQLRGSDPFYHNMLPDLARSSKIIANFAEKSAVRLQESLEDKIKNAACEKANAERLRKIANIYK